MTQEEWELEIAAVTGESWRTIRRLGFQPAGGDREFEAEEVTSLTGVVDQDQAGCAALAQSA